MHEALSTLLMSVQHACGLLHWRPNATFAADFIIRPWFDNRNMNIIERCMPFQRRQVKYIRIEALTTSGHGQLFNPCHLGVILPQSVSDVAHNVGFEGTCGLLPARGESGPKNPSPPDVTR